MRCGERRNGVLQQIQLFLLGLMALILLLYFLLERFLFRKDMASVVLGAMLKAFDDRGERVVEFRGIKKKVQAKVREFEVKTIRQNYYVISMKKLDVISISSIERFGIEDDANCFVRGVIDPVGLNGYRVEYRVPGGEL